MDLTDVVSIVIGIGNEDSTTPGGSGTLYFDDIALLGEPMVIFVDADAVGANNGSSWADAYNHLQDALNSASYGDTIRVAEGVYRPDADTVNPSGSGHRDATFRLIDGVGLEGGYAGFGQPDPDARDIELYETVLSGDLNGNDVQVADPLDLLDETTRAENSYHVVTCTGTNETTVLEGFTITGGHANGSSPHNAGGGLFIDGNANAEVDQCVVRGNAAAERAGGIYVSNSSPTITDCRFEGNHGGLFGGGVCALNASPIISECSFSHNYTRWNGAGITLDNCSSTVANCRFYANSSARGAGLFTWYSQDDILNCEFYDNDAGVQGGAMECSYSDPSIVNCTFSNNHAANNGGGLFTYSSRSTVTNCIFWGDTPNEIYSASSNPTVSHSDIQGGYPGIGNLDTDPLFVDADGPDNIFGTEDDDLHLLPYSPCIDAGDPSGDYTAQTDMDGQHRVLYDNVDIGADEVFPIAGDTDADGDVDLADFARFARHWLKGT